MINDDKTQIIEAKIVYMDGPTKYEINIKENRFMEVYFCSVYKDDKLFGGVQRYTDKEQVMAWTRLILGDYPDCHRGVA